MNFGRDGYLILKNYCQEIINKPRAMEDQPHERVGAFLWCEDWEIIEILKCFFLGKETYMNELPPRRLRENTLWAKADIAEKVDELYEVFKTPEKIVKALRERRHASTPRV